MPREFGTIYRILGDRGYRQADVDAMEVWHVASLLGVGEPEPEAASTAGSSTSGRDRVVERMRSAAEGRPPPEPEPMDPATFAALAGELTRG